MKQPITTEQVLEALTKTVEKYGANTTYRTRRENQGLDLDYGSYCRYVHEDPRAETREPGCLIGVMLHEEFGVSLDDLSRNEAKGADEVRVDDRRVFEFAAGRVARHAQRIQDDGGTWGKALERTREFVGGIR